MRHHHLFDDAHRRICIAKHSRRSHYSSLWVGLQYPSGAKQAVKDGLFKPHTTETPRCLSWYVFTDKGWLEYHKRFKNAPDWFSEEYKTFTQKS